MFSFVVVSDKTQWKIVQYCLSASNLLLHILLDVGYSYRDVMEINMILNTQTTPRSEIALHQGTLQEQRTATMMSRKGTYQQDIGALPVLPYQRRNPSPESKRIVVAHPNDANLLTEATEAGRRDNTSQKSRLQSSHRRSTQKSPPDSLETRPTDADMTAAALAGRRASTRCRRHSNRQSTQKPSSHSNIHGRPEIERDQNRFITFHDS